MTRRREAGSGLAAILGALIAVGGPVACSGSPPVDINYGTEAGADFEAPPPRDLGLAEDGAVDAGTTTTAPDAGTDTGTNDQDAGTPD